MRPASAVASSSLACAAVLAASSVAAASARAASAKASGPAQYQTMWAIGKYTNVTHRATNSIKADDQGRRDHREGHLERHVDVFGNHDAVREGRGRRLRRDAAQ